MKNSVLKKRNVLQNVLIRSVFLFLITIAFANYSIAQPVTVTGQVTTRATGEGLPGVSVLVKGTNTGTITDVDGQYKLEVPGPQATLVFSYVGYTTREVSVDSRSVVDVQLIEDTRALQEVVVIGYGTEKKVNLSGAVDQIDAREIQERPVTNVAQGLQGMVPNLNVEFMSGEPGEAANINIRGFTSINGGDPLILIDGVPSDPFELNRLAPEDIETLSVIKDASAAAIYGARASFGVILVETKSGTREGINFSYSNYFAWDKPTVLPNKETDPYIYLRVRETSTDNTPWDNQNYSDQTYQYARERSDDPSIAPVRQDLTNSEVWEYMGNRDWTRYFLGDYSMSHNHQMGISGASEKVGYYLSGAYNRHNGALEVGDDFFNRYSLRAKVDFSPVEWVTLGNNTYLTQTERNKPTYLDIWALYNLHPTDWDKNPDGTWANNDVGRTGARLADGGKSINDYGSLQSRFTAEFRFWDDLLKINADYTFRQGMTDLNEYTTKYNIGFGPEDIREEGGSYGYRESINENYNVFNIYGTFSEEFGSHRLTAIVGYNQEYYRFQLFSAQRNNLISSSLPTLNLATGEAFVNEEIEDWAIRGAFYRLNYIFRNRYIVEFNGRYDGSSRFPKDKRFGFFPSASVAWRMSEEPFMTGLTGFLSNLKLRASYGSLGNQDVSAYGYIPTMNAYLSNYLIGGERNQRVTPPPLVSPNYTWEEVNTVNIGVDIGLLDDKISGNFDIYRRNTLGMLTQGKELPAVLGADEPQENAADLKTNGWEFSLNYRDEVNLGGEPLFFNTRFILSDNRSYITSFDNPNRNLTQFYEGMELGEMWGLQSDGLFQSEEEISQLDETGIIPWGALQIVPGWPKYKDLDNNGLIEKGLTVDEPKDLSVVGNFSPRLRYGMDLSFNWSGFDFRAFFQGVGQKDYYPLDYLYWGWYQQPYAGGYVHLHDYYRATADSEVERAQHSQAFLDAGLADQNLDAFYPVLQAWMADRNLGERIDQSKGLAIPQTRYMLNGAYLRFKNLTVGYSLPQSLMDRIGLDKVRVFFSGENLMEWSELAEFYDPEAVNDINNTAQYNPATSTARGIGKGYSYPQQRRYSVGLNVHF